MRNKGGRPPKYKAEYAEQAKILYERGFVDTEVAAFFKVTEPTIHNWAKKHPSFAEARGDGKYTADKKVERALFERAVGYSHSDTKFATFEGKITDTKEYTKHYAPDPTSCIFWLKNRQPDQWRDKQHHELTGKDGGAIEYANMTPQELDKRISELSKEIENAEQD